MGGWGSDCFVVEDVDCLLILVWYVFFCVYLIVVVEMGWVGIDIFGFVDGLGLFLFVG